MQIKHYCSQCEGTGNTATHDPYSPPIIITCPRCDGAGYTTQDIIGDDFASLAETLDDLKTKLNHIKNKVDDIWDKVK